MAKKKVAFVTGGSGGIGESICLKLIKEYGYKLDKVIKKKFNTAVVYIIN